MTPYLGDYQYGQTIYVPFATFASTGASVTITGLAVTDIEIYRNGGTTQRASDAGYVLLDTDGIDFDGITGIHGFSIDTADNTTAGFFAPGNEYLLVVSAITVDAVTVNFVVLFSIENRHQADVLLRTTIATLASQTSFTLTAGSVDNDAYNGCEILVQDVASVVQKCVGVVNDYTGATKTITLQTDPAVFTMAATDHVTIRMSRALKPTVDNRVLDVSTGGEAGLDWANVGTPGSTVALSATTVSIVTTTVTATNLTNAPTSGDLTAAMKASVNAEVLDVVNVDTLVAGKTMADALEIIGAMAAGVIITSGTASEIFRDFSGATKVTVTAESDGDRSAVVYAA